MEADFEFEIGPGLPVIDAAWPGLVDLRSDPERVKEIGETSRAAGLAQFLLRLNSSASPFWTAKCDVWLQEGIDPDELDAPANEAAFAVACYIDLLPGEGANWATPDHAESFCRELVGKLRRVPARRCRADLVVRRAMVCGVDQSLGITAYLAGCGGSETDAAEALTTALSAFADSVCTDLRVQEGE